MIRFAPVSSASKLVRVAKPFRLLGLTATLYETHTAGSGSVGGTTTDRDVVMNSVTTGEIRSHYQLMVRAFGGAAGLTPDYTSSDTDIATVDANGLVTCVAPGPVTITVMIGGQSKSIDLNMTVAVISSATTFNSFAVGSLARHVTDAIDSRLAGKTAEESLRVYTTQDHANQIYVRNPNLWCSDLPNLLTCLSPWNSTGANTRAGTLISPQDIIFAAHYQINVNAVLRFVAMDGSVIERTMVSKLVHPSYVPYYPDLVVGHLNEPVPEGFAFAKVLPDNWADYLPSLGTPFYRKLPALTLDQEEKALVTDWTSENAMTGFSVPSSASRLAFYEPKIGGDSGNPASIPVNGDAVLLSVWTYGGAGSGTSIRSQKAVVNSMMTSLGSPYQLTEADFSGFTSYAA